MGFGDVVVAFVWADAGFLSPSLPSLCLVVGDEAAVVPLVVRMSWRRWLMQVQSTMIKLFLFFLCCGPEDWLCVSCCPWSAWRFWCCWCFYCGCCRGCFGVCNSGGSTSACCCCCCWSMFLRSLCTLWLAAWPRFLAYFFFSYPNNHTSTSTPLLLNLHTSFNPTFRPPLPLKFFFFFFFWSIAKSFLQLAVGLIHLVQQLG